MLMKDLEAVPGSLQHILLALRGNLSGFFCWRPSDSESCQYGLDAQQTKAFVCPEMVWLLRMKLSGKLLPAANA